MGENILTTLHTLNNICDRSTTPHTSKNIFLALTKKFEATETYKVGQLSRSVNLITTIDIGNYSRRNQKLIFNMHQGFCLCVNDDRLQPTG